MAIRYIVNEKDRIVVAVIDGCKNDAVNAANAWTNGYDWNAAQRVNTTVYFNKKYYIPDKFTGIARCCEDDEWNEDIGKKIARDRVLDKYHRSLNKAIRKINKDIQAEANRFNERVQKLRDTK